MSRSRPLLRIAALVALSACHARAPAEAPAGRAETTGAASGARPFPTEDARTALRAASPGLTACRADGGPAAVDASVTFAPSGAVEAVGVSPEAGAVTSCVRAKLAEVAVTPFSGDPVTMRARFRL